MDSLATRMGGRLLSQGFYSMNANNHWITNFPILQATKLTVQHVFAFSVDADPKSVSEDFWTQDTQKIANFHGNMLAYVTNEQNA